MYHPTRGGTRGGQAEFTWDQVRSDQHRENYLGHSVFAPTGRWQNSKDVNWYNKDNDSQQDQDAIAEKRRKELIEVKMREEEEMNKRLGIKTGSGTPAVGDVLLRGSKQIGSSSRAGTGSNRAPLDTSKSRWNPQQEDGAEEGKAEDSLTKEERKAAKRLAKMQVKEERREERRLRHEQREKHRYKEYNSSDEETGEDRRVHHPRSSRHSNQDNLDRRSEERSHRRLDGSRGYDSVPARERDFERDRLRHDRDGRDRNYERERQRRYEQDNPRSSTYDQRYKSEQGRDRVSRREQNRSRSPGRSITPEMMRRRRA